jgi:hypothetical protein
MTDNVIRANDAQMTPGFCYPPFHVETFPIGSCVMNRNDFNCLQFAGTPGAKFTNRDAAEKIAADWNATYGR